MSWDALLGSPGGVSPQTSQGQALLDSFLQRYSAGGSVDADRSGAQLAALQDQVLGSRPVSLNFGGASIPIFDPALKGKVKAANTLFARSLDPANAAALELEKYRYGAKQEADPGLLGRMAPGLGALFSALGGGGSGSSGSSWWDTLSGWFTSGSPSEGMVDLSEGPTATFLDPETFLE